GRPERHGTDPGQSGGKNRGRRGKQGDGNSHHHAWRRRREEPANRGLWRNLPAQGQLPARGSAGEGRGRKAEGTGQLDLGRSQGGIVWFARDDGTEAAAAPPGGTGC